MLRRRGRRRGAERLRHHHRDTDSWDRLVVITSKDTNLTKSHGRYPESKLITLATQASRDTLSNGTAPPIPALPEADASDMDYFLARLQIVLPMLGVNAIRTRTPVVPIGPREPPAPESPIFHLRHAKLGVDASAQEIDGEFTMLAGSLVVSVWHGVGKADSTVRAYASYRAQHQRPIDDGSILVSDDESPRLTRDVVFGSPSTAGAVALSRSCNGGRE